MRTKRDKQVCECTNNKVYTNNNEVAIEFYKKREHECSIWMGMSTTQMVR